MNFEYYLNNLKLKLRKQNQTSIAKINLKTLWKYFAVGLVICVGLALVISAIYGLISVFISIGQTGTI
ncbi:hypothetical protein [Mesomycoplasma hyorhinis]|uniref:Uncharacterized protein n=3 Tax=Mesomycoplasma hyorhinis TaxID=2100 RepID=A0ABD6IH17_MESHY|nr:hypothetical protein [Mesomycoplasma hyorhinis]AEC45916.1 hypothetical protein SRH_01785 [Mesomycoplasma hyorhinis MCLD]AEX13874.1 hypothetical protein MYM_0070 [Mesomycoplasma hyorhinis GDL-1]AFX74007.1 hypothetical protein MOS_075 [Mesomycoplasma hyorhinis SK76]AHA40829.1 hypothetical protein Q453_0075 [Mesomycoplasma hyorhinis DBS 1050]MXR06487.1 hypothetical protein [Mesomycoplasma hyorhinis]